MEMINFLRNIFLKNVEHKKPSTLIEESHDPLVAEINYINKNCSSLPAYNISENINFYDLNKLAELNGIKLQIREGWYELLKRLVIELYNNGWDKKVTCIKEKYAELMFYADVDRRILEKYAAESRLTCETCGQRGKIRSENGWDYVACRKHYVENREMIKTVDQGFMVNNMYFNWKDISEIKFDKDKDYYENYKYLEIHLTKKIKIPKEFITNYLLIKSSDYGWGAFLDAIPKGHYSVDKYLITKNKGYTSCKICGYIAVYNKTCECCQMRVWNKKEFDYYDNEEDYVISCQLEWYADNGDIFQEQNKFYKKSTDYLKLVTEEEVIKERKFEEEFNRDH